MRKVISLLFLTSFSIVLFGQTNYAKFKQLFNENDTTGIKELLNEWRAANPNDPEFYTSAFNFYFSQSKKELLTLSRQKGANEALQLKDSAGNVAGYLSSDLGFDSAILSTAFRYIDTAIAKFPNRLDIRAGKCYVLEKIKDYDNFTEELIKTVQYSTVIKNDWLWTENTKLEDGESFFLETIQEYLKELYDTGDDKLLENMKQIGDSVLRHYQNIEILSTTAVAYMLTKNYDQALEYLLQAEKINPKDFIVLNNIAQGYKLKGDKVNAIKYFQLTQKYGDEEAKKRARQSIKELQKPD